MLERCDLPDEVRADMQRFVENMNLKDIELKSLRIHGVKADDIRQLLIETYL